MTVGSGALNGLVVADFSRVMAGPYATMLLGDLGATIIKVEPPGGDDTRRWGPPWADDGVSTYYLSINRNKQSVVLDLSSPADLGAANQLIERADVLIENFKPDSLSRLGLGYEAARELNPAIIYCSITGYGRDVPWAGYDLIAQAVSGLMSLTGSDPLEPTKVGFPVADVLAGLHAAIAVLAAVRHRDATGEGQRVEVNLLSSMISGLTNFAGTLAISGEVATAAGRNRHPSICPYEPFPTADRPLVIAAGNERQFTALCDVLELPELRGDARFATNRDRVAHRDQLAILLRDRLRERSADVWFEQLSAAGVPCGPINDIAAGMALGEALGLDPVVTVEGKPQVASPFRLSATPVSYRLPPPPLGGHNDEVKRWLHGEVPDDQFVLPEAADSAGGGPGGTATRYRQGPAAAG
jgi:crotonobetainyl-CoA:carnitine CoA-transferase CaiB-like acyl-CoA transferase